MDYFMSSDSLNCSSVAVRPGSSISVISQRSSPQSSEFKLSVTLDITQSSPKFIVPFHSSIRSFLAAVSWCFFCIFLDGESFCVKESIVLLYEQL